MNKIFKALIFVLLFASPALAAKKADGTGDGWAIANPNKGSVSGSISCWLKDDTWAEDGAMVNYGVGGATGFMFNQYTTPAVYTVLFQGGGSSGGSVATSTLTANAWHHVAITYGSGSLKTYIDATDGLADQTEVVTDAVIQAASDDFQIALPIASDPFGGPLGSFEWAHCAYYNAVLSGAEIASIADKTTCENAVATHSSNLQILLKGTSGVAVTDSSSNAFTVVESGNPTDSTGPVGLPCDTASSTSAVAILKAIGAL